MKILYSQIKELVPQLRASASEVAASLTMIGFLSDGFQQVEWQDHRDYLISLEVRQNRADCLSVIGVAREIAAYYGLSVQLPSPATASHSYTEDKLNITVAAERYVKRIMATQISGLHNGSSPAWLQAWLILYDINPVNLLVDISNYVMIYTGYTSHLLDIAKMQGGLTWHLNKGEVAIQTLDNTEIKLTGNELVIKDQPNILALAGIVGCQTAALSQQTTDIIVEMAVYDRSLIMENARRLNIITEASNRLSKDLDPEGVTWAFAFLVDMLLSYGQGRLSSQQYNYYLHPAKIRTIILDPNLVCIIAGIAISQEKIVEVLENLRFSVERLADGNLRVTLPSDRLDVSLPEDLAEEVIRLVGYDHIAKDEIPSQIVTPDITPLIYHLKDRVKDLLVSLGWDEVLSQPLVGNQVNQQTNWQPGQSITTQNSVNEEYPDLRQSIASGLLDQLQVYLKKNLDYIQIFEVGRVYTQHHGWQEHDYLGLLWHNFSLEPKLNYFQQTVERLLRHLGLTAINYAEAKQSPVIANPYASYDIIVGERLVGIIYKLQPQTDNGTTYFAELNLELLLELLANVSDQSTVEIIKKIVALDVNVELTAKQDIRQYLQKLRDKIGVEKLWDLGVTDVYPLENNKVRYTLRVAYWELSDQEAKDLHNKIFALK
ncbi:MAG: phenylalanine--tRNA ligase subunit beta [bacterium]